MSNKIIIGIALVLFIIISLAGYLIGVRQAKDLEPKIFINSR